MALGPHADVIVALAGHFAQLAQGLDDPRTILDLAGLDALGQPGGDLPLHVLARGQRQAAWLHDSGARRVLRHGPALLQVPGIPQPVVGALPARRRGVVRLACDQIHAGSEDVHVHAAVCLAVHHRRPAQSVTVQPAQQRPLDVIEHAIDLCLRRLVIRVPGDDARGVFVFELE